MDKKLAIAEYLDVDESEVEEIDINEFETPQGDYLVLTDDEADRAFKDLEEELFRDIGLELYSNDFKEWILNNAIDDEAINNFIDNEIEYFENEGDDSDLLDYLTSLESKSDKISYIKELYGDPHIYGGIGGFIDWAKDNIDFDIVFNELKSRDGRGFLARWDGEELELPGDLYAYRVN